MSCRGQNLTEIPQDLSRELRKLDLSFNKLQVIREQAFTFYPKLEILRLDNNNIINISSSAFDGLRKLRVLDISCNRIGDDSINGGAFTDITKLEFLAIQQNEYTNYSNVHIPRFTRLRYLHVDVFKNFEFDESFLALRNLKVLKFYQRTSIRLQNNSFAGLNNSQIRQLDLSFRVLRPIGYDFLRPFHHLQKLRLDFRGESGIKDILRSLTGLSYRSISSIDMEHNVPIYPVTLTDRDFAAFGTMCIKRINLSRNMIVRIQWRTFWNSTASRCLEEFKMTGDNTGWVPFHAFYIANFINIRKLNVGYERLFRRFVPVEPAESQITKGPLGDTIYSGSKINYTFHFSDTLEEFDAEGIRFPLGGFFTQNYIHLAAKSLKTLKLGNTNLSFCEVHDPYFSTVHANITHFDMTGWFCENLKPTFLSDAGGFCKLETLLARSAKLGQGLKGDKAGVFLKGLNNLQFIDLSKNKLSHLHENFFQDQSHSLRKVVLDYNQFNFIPTAMSDIRKLGELHLQYNLFATFSLREREMINKWANVILNFKGNVFSCTCIDLKALKWFLQNKNKFIDFDELKCHNGKNLTTFLDDIDSFEIRCASREWLIISVSLFLIMTTVIVGTALLYRHRYTTLFYFLQVRNIFKKDTHVGFKYDVYISYTPDDKMSSNWTVNTLYPFLHDRLRLEVALEEKTFSPGISYVDNVNDTMEQSRKIVLVFCKEFRKFSWSQCHLEMAQMHTFHKQRSSMVVIVLNDIPREELPDILRNVWWKMYFIYWPSDEMEFEKRRLFWQQLEMVLYL